MSVKFDPRNPIIQLCMQGMGLEESGNAAEAMPVFQQAWDQASNDFEKFIVAYHIGLRQEDSEEKLRWMEKSLELAQKTEDEAVRSAYPTLYSAIAECYEELDDIKRAKRNRELADSYKGKPADAGPFYHGTRADLKVGEYLTAGQKSNYDENFKMNHIYFAGNINGAGLAAALARGEAKQRVYVVEPTGEFEHDPNVTDKRFPGNLTRSYRSTEPLKIIGEIEDWDKLTEAERQEWEEKLAKNNGEIIN